MIRVPLVPSIFIVNTVVNDTDPNLTNRDTFDDGETSNGQEQKPYK
jgi:hypothetical protein